MERNISKAWLVQTRLTRVGVSQHYLELLELLFPFSAEWLNWRPNTECHGC